MDNPARTIGEVITGIDGLALRGDPTTVVSDITHDSRHVRPGAVFVAIPGQRVNGRDFVGDAVGRGASVVVTEEPVTARVAQVRAGDPRSALAPLAASLFGHPSHDLRVVGVTGTDGKTTTCHLLNHLLTQSRRTTGWIGSLGTVIADTRVERTGTLTTPQADDVQRLLYLMRSRGVDDAIVEASSMGLATHRVDSVRFAAAVITNITDEHIEHHGSVDAYRAAKATLLQRVAETGGPAVLNLDDEACRVLLPHTAGALTFSSIDHRADVYADRVAADRSGTRFTLNTASGSIAVRLPLPGDFNVSNALAASTTALALGVDLTDIAAALESTPGVPGRMTVIDEHQPFSVYVDYAHTIAAVTAVLSHLRQHHPTSRLIAVAGSGLHADYWKRPAIAAALLWHADLVVFTGSDAAHEPPEVVVRHLTDAARKAGGVEGCDYVGIPHRRAAIESALAAAGPGDVVVVLGKGHEPTILLEGQRQVWSEDAEVRATLRRQERT